MEGRMQDLVGSGSWFSMNILINISYISQSNPLGSCFSPSILQYLVYRPMEASTQPLASWVKNLAESKLFFAANDVNSNAAHRTQRKQDRIFFFFLLQVDI